jgi:hypothetical protein
MENPDDPTLGPAELNSSFKTIRTKNYRTPANNVAAKVKLQLPQSRGGKNVVLLLFFFEDDFNALIHWQYMLFSHSNTLFCILLIASPDVSTSILFLHALWHSILFLFFLISFANCKSVTKASIEERFELLIASYALASGYDFVTPS